MNSISSNSSESTSTSNPINQKSPDLTPFTPSFERIPLLPSTTTISNSNSIENLNSKLNSLSRSDKVKMIEEGIGTGTDTNRSSIDEKQRYTPWIAEDINENDAQKNSLNSLKIKLNKVVIKLKRAWELDGIKGLAGFAPRIRLSPNLSSSTSRTSLQKKQDIFIIAVSIFTILAILGFLTNIFSTKSIILPPSLLLLSSSGHDAAVIDRTTGKLRSNNQAKVLESFSNPYGYINLVDPYAGGVFNPSILVLPDTVGIGFRYLLVARGPEKFEIIDGDDTRWENVVGCFLLPMKREYLGLPYLARETELQTLNLPAQRKMEFDRCQDPSFDQFIGAEDPRLFFTNIGQPLLIYSQTGNSPDICRAIFIIDARVVIDGLGEALSRGGWSPPIDFKEQTALIREDQTNIEKNWSPFLGENDELYFHVSLVPQKIYKYIPGHALRSLPLGSTSSTSNSINSSHNCLTELVGADMDRVKFHHASPLLRVTLCRRGECKPDIHNTVLFAIIHIKYHPLPYLHYERRVVTWNVTSPYEYLSVSKPLTYSGVNQADPIFTVSMSWNHPTKKNGLGLNHGYLDDILITSFGVYDYGSAYIDVLARDLLTDHTLCAGTEGSELWG